MKLIFDINKKMIDVEGNVEKLVEKGIDNSEKGWKEKFATRHNAKKELMEIKHSQKIELENSNNIRKNWVQKIQEENRKTKELELAEQRRLKELELEEMKLLENKNLIITIAASIVLCLTSVVFFIAGSPSDPASNFVGMFLFFVVGYMLGSCVSNKKKIDKKDKDNVKNKK